MRSSLSLLVLAGGLALASPSSAIASDDADAEVRAWSQAYSAWVDVSHNIACPALVPRIEVLTKRLENIQDAFIARHPDYVFPPMIFASAPFVDCVAGAELVTRAEARATLVAGLVGAVR